MNRWQWAVLIAAIGPQELRGQTTRISVSSGGEQGTGGSFYPAITPDGRFIAFKSRAPNLVEGDHNNREDVFLRDRFLGTTERVSLSHDGGEPRLDCLRPDLSPDARFVVFDSYSDNLVPDDRNARSDVFLVDRLLSTIERVSVATDGAEANGDSIWPTISADGRLVSFESVANNLVPEDTNKRPDIFVHDRSTGVTERVSVAADGSQRKGYSRRATLSDDGCRVAFESDAAFVDNDYNGTFDVFVRDRCAGKTFLASMSRGGVAGNGWSLGASISADGSRVVFVSVATNLVRSDMNATKDVFVRVLDEARTVRANLDCGGLEIKGDPGSASLSADGRIVAFTDEYGSYVPGDPKADSDLFLRDLERKVTLRASVDSDGNDANGPCSTAVLAAGGRTVAFVSDASNLVAGDTNASSDIFAVDLPTTSASFEQYGAGHPGTDGVPALSAPRPPVLGSCVELELGNSYGQWTIGLLLAGFQSASIPTAWGGELLVLPDQAMLVPLPGEGEELLSMLPLDVDFAGLSWFLQLLLIDPGASHGVAFSAGLELRLGG